MADISGSTVRINGTLSFAAGDSVWHRNISGQASADGIAIVALHALCVGSTGGGVARIRPFHTALALTDKPKLAVWVTHTLRPASSDRVWLWYQTRLTPTYRVSGKVDSADGSWTTGRRDTRVRLLYTLLIAANKARLTIRISHTFWLASRNGVWVGYQTSLASADGIACSSDSTVSPWAAGRRVAGVWLLNASLALAHETLLTVRVPHTLRLAARDCVRVGYQSLLTTTDGVAGPCDRAPGTRTTWGRIAGVWFLNTSLALADKALLAIRISYTLRLAASDGVWVGDKAGLALANGVALPVDRALGPRSAGVRRTRVWLFVASEIIFYTFI